MSKKIIGGTAQVRVAGETIDVLGDITYSPVEEEKEIRRGVDGHYNPKVTPVTPFVEMKISDASSLDVVKLATAENVSVVVILRNTKIFTLVNADQVNRVTVDAIDSSMTLKYEGKAKPVETLGA